MYWVLGPLTVQFSPILTDSAAEVSIQTLLTLFAVKIVSIDEMLFLG